MKSIIYLTNNKNTLELYRWLKQKACVHLFSDKLTLDQAVRLNPDLIISYNYRYLISSDIIAYMDGRMINLHCSCLPWNRGADPNFWSFYDHTPKGVTIHQISEKLDRGKILYQKECFFYPENETFATTYCKLHNEMDELLKMHWEDILSGSYELYDQPGSGSYHSSNDLKRIREYVDFQWTDNIQEILGRISERQNDIHTDRRE